MPPLPFPSRRLAAVAAALLAVAPLARPAFAQRLHLGLLGGSTDLTAGGWSLTTLLISEARPYSFGLQLGNKGAGAMAELAWHPQRGPRGPWSDVDAFEYFSLGIGSRFGPRGYGVSWGQWNLLAGSRLMPADHHGLVFDVGVGMFGTLGGSSPDGVNGGFAGRVLFGWVF